MSDHDQAPLLPKLDWRMGGSLNTPAEESEQRTERSGDKRAPRVNVSERLLSLDVVRGLTVAVMIFVDDAGGALQGYVDHSPWDNPTFADFVMPFFLFMVGTSMSMSFKWHKDGLLKKVLIRTAKLFLIGLATQGANFPSISFFYNNLNQPGFDLKYIRIPGILQRIAWAYLCVSLMAMYFPKVNLDRVPAGVSRHFGLFIKYGLHWLASFCFLFVYIVVMKQLYVPNYIYTDPVSNATFSVPCNKRGDLSEACNAARQVDLWIMGWNHMYSTPEYTRSASCQVFPRYSDCPLPHPQPWCGVPMDPEGILSSLPTVLTTFIGFHFGNVLIQYKGHRERLIQWTLTSTVLFFTGLGIHYGGWHINKQLWSPSYLFFMAGSTGYILTFFYTLMDFTSWQPAYFRKPIVWTNIFIPFQWVGLNTFFVYLMAAADVFDSILEWFYWSNASNNLVDLAFDNIFCYHPFPRGDDDVPPVPCVPFDVSSVCHGGVFKGVHTRYATTVFVLFRVGFWFCIAGLLHRYKWYWVL